VSPRAAGLLAIARFSHGLQRRRVAGPDRVRVGATSGHQRPAVAPHNGDYLRASASLPVHEDHDGVTRIYLDPTALVLPSASPEGGDEHVVPGTVDAVAHLVDAGFEVIVLGNVAAVPLRELAKEVGHEPQLPAHLDHDDWFLTGDPHPAFGRPRGGTTVLVGPRRPAGKVPLPRFDLEARDMPSAMMEILTRQAMA
jgi:hypothetical protein